MGSADAFLPGDNDECNTVIVHCLALIPMLDGAYLPVANIRLWPGR